MSHRSNYPGFVTVKDKIPYHGKNLSDLGRSIAAIGQSGIQRILIEQGTGFINIEKLVPESQAPESTQLSLYDFIRNRKMEEYSPDKDKSCFQQLWDIFDILQSENLEVGFIAIGSKQQFQRWIGMRLHITSPKFFGIPIHIVSDIPPDVFIVCGTPDKNSDMDEIRVSVKVTLP